MRRTRRTFLRSAGAALGVTLIAGLTLGAAQPAAPPAPTASTAGATLPLDTAPVVLGPADPTAVGLAAGEEYVIRCDRFAAIGVNVPDMRPRQ